MPDLVRVRVRDCACPDSPHAEEGDVVYLAPKVSLDLGVTFKEALQDAVERPEAERVAYLKRETAKAYIRYGVRGANFLDPYDPEALIEDYELAEPVAEAADSLYSESLLRPLAISPSTPSRGGRTGGSTSRTKRSRTTSPE